MSNKDIMRARICLIAAVMLFGTIGIFRRNISLPSGTLAMTRGFIGFFSLGVISLIQRVSRRRKEKAEKSKDSPGLKKWIVLALSGSCIGFNWILLFEAYNYTSVATATLCYYMAPVIVLALSPLVLKEKMSLKKALCILAALLGMVLVSGVVAPQSGSYVEKGFRGVLLGLGAACLYACVILLNKQLKDIRSIDRTLVQLLMAGIVLVPYVLIKERPVWTGLDSLTIWMVLIVGVVHTGCAYALYFSSMEKLPAQSVALMSYIDPVLAVLLSALLLSETMGIGEIIGTVIVLSAALISELPERNNK